MDTVNAADSPIRNAKSKEKPSSFPMGAAFIYYLSNQGYIKNLGKPIQDILSIYPKAATTGKDAGKTKYYLKSFIPFFSGNEEVQVYVEDGKSNPEEIVRQLWVYKPSSITRQDTFGSSIIWRRNSLSAPRKKS